MSLYEFAKVGLLPGALGLLFLGLLLGLGCLCSKRTIHFGVLALAGITAGYWAMSMPVGAWALGKLVSAGYSPLVERSEMVGIQAIVVLDAATARYGREDVEIAVVTRTSAVRAAEAIRLYRMIQPQWVVVTSGAYRRAGKSQEGEAMRELMVTAGIPADRVVLDSASRNTREHASNVSALLRARGVTRFVLVTSSVHMRRAMRAFSGTGLQAVAAPAPVEEPGAFPWWPNTADLDRSWEAWYEVFGLVRDLARSVEN